MILWIFFFIHLFGTHLREGVREELIIDDVLQDKSNATGWQVEFILEEIADVEGLGTSFRVGLTW